MHTAMLALLYIAFAHQATKYTYVHVHRLPGGRGHLHIPFPNSQLRVMHFRCIHCLVVYSCGKLHSNVHAIIKCANP